MRQANDGEIILQELFQAGEKAGALRADGPARGPWQGKAGQDVVVFICW